MNKWRADKPKIIEPWVGDFIRDQGFMVLRDRRTGISLGVSYTEEGLKWTTNKHRKLLYYKNAYISHTEDGKPFFKGDLRKSPTIIVEKFVPQNFSNPKFQSIEYRWVDKALRMCYVPWGEQKRNFSLKSKLRVAMAA